MPRLPEVKIDEKGTGYKCPRVTRSFAAIGQRVAGIHAAEAIAVVSDRLRMPNESAPLYTY